MRGALLGLGLALLVAAGASPAVAQGFECSHARLKSERLVCQDSGLRKLDGTLTEAYLTTLDWAVDSQALRASQRAWLGGREACADRACLAALYATRLAELDKVPRAGMVTYRDPQLGVAFRHPANQKIAPCDGQPRCIVLSGLQRGRVLPLLQLQAVDGPLEKAARDEAGFELKGGRWMTTYGRFEPVPVETLEGSSWRGMKAIVTCGVEVAGGFHAAAGECLWAVLSNGRRTILATTEGLADNNRALLILDTLTFDP